MFPKNKSITFIGDVHGKIDEYLNIIEKTEMSIQLGDFGVGFNSYENDLLVDITMRMSNGFFIRGNHDNPKKVKQLKSYIPDGTYWQDQEMFFVGGGLSIDRMLRTEGVDWWPDEELSQQKLQNILDSYMNIKPRIMVSHECPETVARLMLNTNKVEYPSITRQAFEAMFCEHQPEYWIFGHWHQSFQMKVNGTNFVCLDELETFTL